MRCPSFPLGLLEDLFPLASQNQHLGVNLHYIRTLPLSIDDAIFHHQALPLSPVSFCSQTELGHFVPPGFFSSFRQPSPDQHDVGVFSRNSSHSTFVHSGCTVTVASLWFFSGRRQVMSSSTSSGDSLSVLLISGSPLSELLPLSCCTFGRLLKPSALP